MIVDSVKFRTFMIFNSAWQCQKTVMDEWSSVGNDKHYFKNRWFSMTDVEITVTKRLLSMTQHITQNCSSQAEDAFIPGKSTNKSLRKYSAAVSGLGWFKPWEWENNWFKQILPYSSTPLFLGDKSYSEDLAERAIHSPSQQLNCLLVKYSLQSDPYNGHPIIWVRQKALLDRNAQTFQVGKGSVRKTNLGYHLLYSRFVVQTQPTSTDLLLACH